MRTDHDASLKSASSRSARRLPTVHPRRPHARGRSQGAARSAASSASRRMPAASAAASPGSTSSAFTSSVRTSRIDGRSDATIARPAAMYSNSLSGDVTWVEIADVGFGQRRGCRPARAAPAPPTGGTCPVKVDAIVDARVVHASARRRAQIGLLFVAADDQRRRPRAPRQRVEQDVDALPRVEVPGIADDRSRCGPATPDMRPLRGVRSPDSAIGRRRGTTASARRGPKPLRQLVGKARGDRDVAVRPAARPALRARPGAASFAGCGCRAVDSMSGSAAATSGA